MTDLVLKLLVLAGAILPPWLALAGLWRRVGRGLAPGEVVLASAISLPVFINIEVVALGMIPWDRPLDSLRGVHAGLCALCLIAAYALRREVAEVFDQCAGNGARAVRSAGVVIGLTLVVGVTGQTGAAAWGAYCVPWTIDELAYHLPQALQLWQDGRVDHVAGNRIWIDSYPRGAAIVYYWTIGLTGSDAGVHAVNGVCGFVLMLAAYCGARRLGIDRRFALLAGAIVSTAPIVFYLSTIGYIDLMVGVLIASALVFALPGRGGAWSWPSFVACLIGLLMALWMKFAAVVPTGVILGLRGLASLHEVWVVRRDRIPRPSPGPVGITAAGGLMLALASIPYVQTWVVYGIPTYPVTLRLGPILVFKGPMDLSLFGRDNQLPLIERLTRFWTGWFEPVVADSPGSLGPLFLMVMLPAAAVLSVATLSSRRSWCFPWLLALAVFWIVPLTPEHHVPRYGLYALLVGACATAWLGQKLSEGGEPTRPAANGWIVLVLALVVFNTWLSARSLMQGIRWQLGYQLPMLTPSRNRAIFDLFGGRLNNASPAPATLQFLYGAVPPGELLATSVDGIMAAFYDARYRYRVEHRPADPWPYGFAGASNLDHGIEHQAGWLARQQRDAVAFAMVYKGSVEDRALAGDGSGFDLVYEQAPEENAPVIRIWRRRGR